MSNYLDKDMPSGSGEVVMDTTAKKMYDSRYYTLFQRHKFLQEYIKMRPDLNDHDSHEWAGKFHLAEQVIHAMAQTQVRNAMDFTARFDMRYRSMLDETWTQIRQFNATRLQLREGLRTGPYEEVQTKINFFDKIMDKVQGYDMLYPYAEGTSERQAHADQISVSARQDAVRDRLLREMGVDYALLK